MKKLYILVLALASVLAATAETWTLNGSNYTATYANNGAVSFDGCTIYTVKLTGPRKMSVWYAELNLGKKNANFKISNGATRSTRTTVPNMATALKNKGVDWRVGINSDLFSAYGAIGTTIVDGEVIKTAKTATAVRAIGFDSYDHSAHTGNVNFTFGALLNNTPFPSPQWVNVPHEANETNLYTTYWGSTTPTSTTSCVEVVLTPQGGKLKSYEPTVCTVKSAPVSNKGGASIPSGCIVLSSNNANYASYLKNMKVGDTFTISPSSFSINNGIAAYSFKDLRNMVGGTNLLCAGGKRSAEVESQYCQIPDKDTRRARSAVGYDNTNKILKILIVEASSSSAGATAKELADMMLAIKCADALYWDGGGSTTMNTAGAGVLNYCSDGSPRAVAQGFFFINDPSYDPANDPANKENGVEDIVADDFDPDAPVEYFNLQGIPVAEPHHGEVYIIRQGSKSRKVIL